MDRKPASTADVQGSSVSAPQASSTPRPAAPAAQPAPFQGARPGSRIAFKVRWINPDGEVVNEAMQVLSSTGRGLGQIARPEGWPSGTYRLEFIVNDAPAATMDFEVR
jgi:hypothetical protein